MEYPLYLRRVNYAPGLFTELYMPDPDEVKQRYSRQAEQQPEAPFPYWTRLWPASLALAQYISEHTHWVTGKKVVELAAGLGLPSLVAAPLATEIHSSDLVPEAVAALKKSFHHHGCTHCRAEALSWSEAQPGKDPCTLLLSDINYDTAVFPELRNMLDRFLEKGATILLSSPQRLMAKPFIDGLRERITEQEEYSIRQDGVETGVTVFVIH